MTPDFESIPARLSSVGIKGPIDPLHSAEDTEALLLWLQDRPEVLEVRLTCEPGCTTALVRTADHVHERRAYDLDHPWPSHRLALARAALDAVQAWGVRDADR